MTAPQTSDFASTREVIEQGIREGLHPGAQLCVSRDGKIRMDEASGKADRKVAMSRDSIMLWLSAGKPITAVAIGQLVERGKLGWNDAVTRFIPEFARHGKGAITIRHLLTHTAGLRQAD